MVPSLDRGYPLGYRFRFFFSFNRILELRKTRRNCGTEKKEIKNNAGGPQRNSKTMETSTTNNNKKDRRKFEKKWSSIAGWKQ
mmetsp:Transcript_26522/g.67949  ORF Transcript_26522/g.67949 Transcript_26522/m.67949 type:complete len:83 (+) Transcript_26522:3758-4006(+)